VAQGCSNRRWMRGLRCITETEEINQFVNLWHLLSLTQLSHQPDLISWRFTPNSEYSAKSAYLMQFEGSFEDYDWNKRWHTKAEGKCLFFCWIILQNKIWTADRINKHGGSADQALLHAPRDCCAYASAMPLFQSGMGKPCSMVRHHYPAGHGNWVPTASGVVETNVYGRGPRQPGA
jgi:hypothetical protein